MSNRMQMWHDTTRQTEYQDTGNVQGDEWPFKFEFPNCVATHPGNWQRLRCAESAFHDSDQHSPSDPSQNLPGGAGCSWFPAVDTPATTCRSVPPESAHIRPWSGQLFKDLRSSLQDEESPQLLTPRYLKHWMADAWHLKESVSTQLPARSFLTWSSFKPELPARSFLTWSSCKPELLAAFHPFLFAISSIRN